MVSQNVIKMQVEEKGRVVGPQCQRRPMDKRACESMLGGQTHCQTHRHQTHEGKAEEREREQASLCSWVEKSSLRAHLAESYCCELVQVSFFAPLYVFDHF